MHWQATAASSSARVSKCRLAIGSSMWAHSVSAGWNSGVMGRQVDEADALGDREAGHAVPSGVVEHQEDDPFLTRAGLAREEREHVLEVARGKTPVERYQKLSPVAGETKAVT